MQEGAAKREEKTSQMSKGPKCEQIMMNVDACPKEKPKNRLTVAAVVLGALRVDADGVRVVHISAK